MQIKIRYSDILWFALKGLLWLAFNTCKNNLVNLGCCRNVKKKQARLFPIEVNLLKCYVDNNWEGLSMNKDKQR